MMSAVVRQTSSGSITTGPAAAAVILFTFFCINVPPASAQALYGSIVGTITDATGSAVPGATVTALHTETGQTRTATTTPAGVYSFPTLPSGTYTISISLSGFQTFTRRNVTLNISDTIRVDARLQVDSVSEAVDVSAQTLMLQTDRADVQGRLTTKVPLDLFSPRLGVAYRATETFVVRAGYGINYDPQPLSFVRNLLGVYPQSLGYGLLAPANANVPAGRLRDGLPPEPRPDLSTGVISIDPTTGFFVPPDEYKMGYIESWNLTFEKQLPWKFIGQIGYVGSRQEDILQTEDRNAGQIPGAGRNGQPL